MEHIIKRKAHEMDACGQFSIAMTTGHTVEKVAAELGYGGLSSIQITDYLERHGFSNGEVTASADITGVGIMIIGTKTEGHAVAFENGVIYDPNGERFGSRFEILQYYRRYHGEMWEMKFVFPVAPVKVREWLVAAPKHEEETV